MANIEIVFGPHDMDTEVPSRIMTVGQDEMVKIQTLKGFGITKKKAIDISSPDRIFFSGLFWPVK